MTLASYHYLNDELSPLQALATKVAEEQAGKRDLIADTRNVSLYPADGKISVSVDLPGGVEDFPASPRAHQQIAQTVDVPWKTYDRLQVSHPDLLSDLVNGLMFREPEKRMIRILHGKVRAVLSDRYARRDNVDLLQHLLPVLAEYPDVQFKKCDLTESRLYIKTFLPGFSRQVTPKVGDIVRGGVIISNSEVGSGSLYIYPYTDRLVCLNGMVHTDFGQRRVHLGKRVEETDEAYELYSDETLRLDDQAFFAKCGDTLRGCLTEVVFDQIVKQMQDLAEITVEKSPVDAVETLAQKHSLTGVESDSILKHLIQGGDLSAWGYVNALTATARDTADADRQTEIEILAGKLTAEPAWATA